MNKYKAVLITYNGDVLVEEFPSRREAVEFIENDWMAEKMNKNWWVSDMGELFVERV